MNPPLDRFSRPLPYEDRDLDRELEIRMEVADQKREQEVDEPDESDL